MLTFKPHWLHLAATAPALLEGMVVLWLVTLVGFEPPTFRVGCHSARVKVLHSTDCATESCPPPP